MDLPKFRKKAKIYESENLKWLEFNPGVWTLIPREPISCSVHVEERANQSYILSISLKGQPTDVEEIIVAIVKMIHGQLRYGNKAQIIFDNEEYKQLFHDYIDVYFEDKDFVFLSHEDKYVLSKRVVDIISLHDVDRSDMPQIAQDDMLIFVDFLTNHGVKVSYETFYIDEIKPTQNQVNMGKVKHCLRWLVDNQFRDVKTFMVDEDKYLLDGHHTLAALDFTGVFQWDFVQVHLPVDQLITWTKAFGKVDFRTIHENKKKLDMLKFTEFLGEADAAKDSLSKPKTFTDRAKERLDKKKETFDDEKEREMSAARERDFQTKERERETALKKRKQEKATED